MRKKTRIFLTGDTHGRMERFQQIGEFCKRADTTKEDVLIILGDAGINFYGVQDVNKKEYLQSLPVTLFCIHGNHEMRPSTLPYYKIIEWHGGVVYYEDEYPDILFARDERYMI